MNKNDFPIFRNNPGLIYLDNSATAQKPEAVIKAIGNFYEHTNANIHRGIYTLSQKATLAYEDARKTVANFIGAEPEEIIFTKGTTESLNFLAAVLSKNLAAGDELVLTEMEHHSNLVPWQVLAQEKGLAIKFIPVNEQFRLDFTKAKEMITSKTKLVSVVQMSNVLGAVNPIKELAELAHSVGAVLIADAAQSAAHLPINVKDLDCDFLVFSGHKLCGPTGIGVLYGKKNLLEQLDPYQYGGGMIKEVALEKSSWADLPEKFEAGTPPIAEAVGLAAAINYLQSLGMVNIEQYHRQLTQRVLEKLKSIPGLKLFGPDASGQRGPIFSFTLEGIHPHDAGELLDRQNIAVRAGHHCAQPLLNKFNLNGAIRASFYFYNDPSDADQLIQALSNLVAVDRPEITSSGLIASSELTEEQEIYKENVLDHYQHPHNKGYLPAATLANKEVNQFCGDTVEIFLQIEEGRIDDIKWNGQGCVISQASISLLSDQLGGLSLEEAEQISEQKILDLLGIPISPARIKCALLSLRALQGALKIGQ